MKNLILGTHKEVHFCYNVSFHEIKCVKGPVIRAPLGEAESPPMSTIITSLLSHFRLHRDWFLGWTGCVCVFHVLCARAAHEDESATSGVSISSTCSSQCFQHQRWHRGSWTWERSSRSRSDQLSIETHLSP